MNFDKLFATATRTPAHPDGLEFFDDQRRLALDPECRSRQIETLSSHGMTSAVILAKAPFRGDTYAR